MPENVYIQYGCFGLLAVLVVWTLWKGIPGLLDKHERVINGIATEHRSAVQTITAEFAEESRLCREERLELAKVVVADREADRTARHEMAEKLNQIALNIKLSSLASPPTPTPTPPRPST